MIVGTNKNMNEFDYREITVDSSSSLKDFSFDRKKYYKRYILNEAIKEEESQAIVMGKLVETLLLEPDRFNDRFFTSSCVYTPTGLMLEFVQILDRKTAEYTVDGTLTKPFKQILAEAYADSNFKISFEAVIKKFNDSDAEIYYNELITVREKNLIVVSLRDITNATAIVEELTTNPFVADVVNLVSSKRYSVHNQYQVDGFRVDGLDMKAMMDKVIVDHAKRTVQAYDLKCIWSVENFYENYYLYRRAYIQAYIYYEAAKAMARKLSEETEGESYVAFPLAFIVCDSSNYYSPLIYILNEEEMEKAYYGFEYKQTYYPGVKEIIEDLKFALEYNIWNISRTNYMTKGIVKL